ncbi:MAG: sigma-54-dependent Fis family transcriptional regulator [Proteobacteria bacterium]|nr:sigma-54-dependent Fis family transcriptional regulator [Pseudomonadota bacterium]
MVAKKRVLVVDDEDDIRELLDLTLAKMGLVADCAASLTDARRLLEKNSYQLCLTDMRLPDGEGLSLVRIIGEQYPTLPVAVITAHGSAENAVSALKAGAFDYLAKPVALDQLRALIRGALNLPGAVAAGQEHGTTLLLGQSAPITEVRTLIGRISRSQAPVHITGESGSGKELVARSIHGQGVRQEGPFVPVNCGAIPESLMESEFFGYRKGAFTGADSEREGFFQAARGGTLFLDEVADLPLSMQVKLLRAIQEKRVRRIGSTTEENVDVRIISATHQNLRQLVEAGRFRQDLLFRLNVIELRLPALRECVEDVPLLARAILARLAGAHAVTAPELTAQAIDALQRYAFPGNVRELENILERALALMAGTCIDVSDLNLAPAPMKADIPAGQLPLQEFLDSQERQAILDALQKTRYNQTAAARLLGVTFRSLRYRLDRLGLKE